MARSRAKSFESTGGEGSVAPASRGERLLYHVSRICVVTALTTIAIYALLGAVHLIALGEHILLGG